MHISLVRFFRVRLVHDAQIEAASRLKPFMAQDLLDISDGTTVLQQVRCGGMPYDVRGDRL